MGEKNQGGAFMPPPPAPAADPKQIIDPVVDPLVPEPKKRDLTADEIVMAQEGARLAEEAAQKKAAAAPSRMKGYWVEALGPGVYKRNRHVAGSKFIIEKWEDLGSWMKCANPKLEEKHQSELSEKKKKLHAAKK